MPGTSKCAPAPQRVRGRRCAAGVLDELETVGSTRRHARGTRTPDTFALGAHLVFVRRTYEHHAFYAGDGMLLGVHRHRRVRETTFAEVRRTSRYWIASDDDRRHAALFTGPEALQRARRRSGEDALQPRREQLRAPGQLGAERASPLRPDRPGLDLRRVRLRQLAAQRPQGPLAPRPARDRLPGRAPRRGDPIRRTTANCATRACPASPPRRTRGASSRSSRLSGLTCGYMGVARVVVLRTTHRRPVRRPTCGGIE